MRFILITSAYCFVLVLSVFLLKPLHESYYPDYSKNRNRIVNGKESDMFLLGTSHANSIKMNLLRKGVGLTVSKQNHGGADLFEIIYQVKSIKRLDKRPKIFIVVFSPFLFFYDNFAFTEEGKHSRREKRIRLYASYGNYSTLINKDFSNYLFAAFSPIITPDHLQRALAPEPTDPKRKVNTKKEGYLKKDVCDKQKKRKKLDYHAISRGYYDYRAKGGHVRNMAKNADYDISARSFNSLSRLLEEYSEDLFVFYTPPYWRRYNRGVPDYIRRYNDESLAKIEKFANVRLLHFPELQEITMNPCNFSNSDHLNNKGSVLFTKMLVENLKSLLDNIPLNQKSN